jgi:uncharacterized repeat protein (TIGR03803 family)
MKTTTITEILALLLCFAAPGAAAAPKTATFRVVASMQYPQPGGLWQRSPRLFYTSANTDYFLSVTTGGAVNLLFTAPAGYRVGYLPVTAPNGRSYSYYEFAPTIYPMSIITTPGSLKVYPPTTTGAGYIQGLPNGTLFGIGNYYLYPGNFYLAIGNENGVVTPFYEFPVDQAPLSPIYAADGNFYGVSWQYTGTGAGPSYVFKVTPAGVFTKIVDLPSESFTTGNGGSFFQANDGNFYGSTSGANAAGGIGTLYEVTPSGQYSLLYSFGLRASATPDVVFQASDGNFYGVTQGVGGPTTAGQIFELTKGSYQYTSLHTMAGFGGACPCTMIQGSDGILYGTAAAGGSYGAGTVFALDAGLPKPAPQALSFRPTSGPVGTKVRIWGYNLLQASAQFNGTAATTVANAGPQYVWATVPTGATSGPITITTPGGASVTSASFTVQ